MFVSRSARPLTFQVTVTVIALAALALAMTAGFGFYAVMQADQDALLRQQMFVRTGVAEQIIDLKREQESVATWDDSVVNAKGRNDAWLDENLGLWMATYYGHDRTYVLDEHNAPTYAVQDGKRVEPGRFAHEAPAILPIVGKLRDAMAWTASYPGATLDAAKAVADVVVIGGRPALVSAVPIRPSSSRVKQAPGTEFVYVSAQMVDDDLIGRIARHYQLDEVGFTFRQPQDKAAIALENKAGETVGYIFWDQYRPGRTLMRQIAPAFIVGILLAAGVLAYLLRRLRRASAQLQFSQHRAQYLAFHDTLTGLPNRALFEDRFRRALAAMRRGQGHVGLLCLDLDKFKQVNDTLGHPAGDELVRQVAQRLGNALREIDTVARLGGDEFAVVLVDIRSLRTAELLSQRIIEDLRAPFVIQGNQVFIDASIGIAVAPELGSDADEMLRKADIALYEAKKAGGGTYQVFAGGMDDILLRRRQVEADLRAALEDGEAVGISFDPVYGPAARGIVGALARPRWEHPVHGALPAAQLMAIAEESGLARLLCRRVLDEAVAFAAAQKLPFVAVSMGATVFRDAAIVADVMAILAAHELPPSRLRLDVCEALFAEADDVTRDTVATLRGAGVRIALEDFGAGASSLTLLRRNPIDVVVLDASLCRMAGEPKGQAMLRALADLARSLGATAAAKSLAQRDERDALVEAGCTELSGPLYRTGISALELRMRMAPPTPSQAVASQAAAPAPARAGAL